MMNEKNERIIFRFILTVAIFVLIFLLSGCVDGTFVSEATIHRQNEEILNRLDLLEDTINEIEFRTEVTYREFGADDLDYISSQLDKIYSEYDWIEDELEEMRQWVYYGTAEGSDFTRLEVLNMLNELFRSTVDDFYNNEMGPGGNWLSYDYNTWTICEGFEDETEGCWSLYKELEYLETHKEG